MKPLAEHKNRPLNIAVIGSGIAGMSAAWLLDKAHNVTLYEKEGRIGGHSNTVDAPVNPLSGSPRTIPVDTGFIVYNERNYPNLTALFRYLGVPTKASDMSFAASLDHGRFEYSGTDLNGLFGQRSNLLRPRFWRMLRDILRFYNEGPQQLLEQDTAEISLGEFLARNGYSHGFADDHLLPMGAAIWSTTAREMLDYPALSFIRFFESHGLLRVKDRPQWRTVDGGSRAYVERLVAGLRDRIRFSGVRSIMRGSDGVNVCDMDGKVDVFDHVVLACHADEAIGLMADSDPLEKRLFSPWRYTTNRAVLHFDAGLMPKRRRVWSSWNFIAGDGPDTSLCVTYWMNRLQSLETKEPLLVTLNPCREPDPRLVIREFQYTHPFFDTAALASQRQLWSLQGYRRTWYCGSYFGYGFHEDALQSGLAVAEQLGGVLRPWIVDGQNDRIHFAPTLSEAAA